MRCSSFILYSFCLDLTNESRKRSLKVVNFETTDVVLERVNGSVSVVNETLKVVELDLVGGREGVQGGLVGSGVGLKVGFETVEVTVGESLDAFPETGEDFIPLPALSPDLFHQLLHAVLIHQFRLFIHQLRLFLTRDLLQHIVQPAS